tara:strand:- start:171 stop:596 length:426 start_codon:yes stop_codon:yes gene_type:complete
MRSMRAGQWVAFDASTEKPHKCGKKNKEDPNIKELAKQKNKIQETENVDLGYESEIDLEIETLEAKLEDIKKKENQENLEREREKISRRLNEDNVNIQQNINYQIDKEYPTLEKKNKGWEFYFWIFVVVLNLLALARCVSD